MVDATDSTIPQLVKDLTKAAEKLSQQQEEERQASAERIANLQHREDMVRQAINGLTESSNGSVPAKRDPLSSISDERLQMVVGFLREHPRSRQQDIAKKLKLNTGTVSVAVRRLARAGLIEKSDVKERKSQVWIMPDAERETVLIPGEGVRQGRRRRDTVPA